MTVPAVDPVCTVRVHPDADPDDPDATRIVRIAVAHDTEWPWRRLTGSPTHLPARDSDVSAWPVQGLSDLAVVLGHHVPMSGSGRRSS